MINPAGLERIASYYRQEFYERLIKSDNYTCMGNITPQEFDSLSIGQLFALATMREDKLQSLQLQSIDKEGTLYLTFCGMYGGMELDGCIHT